MREPRLAILHEIAAMLIEASDAELDMILAMVVHTKATFYRAHRVFRWVAALIIGKE